ncbi:MAG TPA: hypothetical protein VLC53_08485 [Myxococcota bacterium]|nr:hypothetical protein [Myxococcota bacterium]
MARLLPLLIFLLIAVVLYLARRAAPSRPRDGRTYRPRTRSRGRARPEDGGLASVRRDELTGLRDAYSGEPLDATRPLVRCSSCRALYHADSAGVLARDNGGRCAACGSTDFAAVKVLHD